MNKGVVEKKYVYYVYYCADFVIVFCREAREYENDLNYYLVFCT